MCISRCLFILFFLQVFVPGWALTLSEALTIAASHPALIESGLNIDQADAAAKDAGKRGTDAISLQTENVSGQLPGFSQAENTATFRRAILDRKRTQAQMRMAALSIDGAKLELVTVKKEIGNRVQAAFHKVVGLQNLLQNAEELSRINLAMFEATKSRFEAGASPEQEIVKAQLDVDRVEIERKNIEGQLAEGVLSLYREMGSTAITHGEPIGTLTPDIGLPKVETLQQRILESHPNLLTVEQNLKENHARVELLKTENRPSFNWIAGARNFQETGNHTFVFAVEADLPNKSANRGARDAARIEAVKIETAREKTQRELLTTLQEQINRFQRSKETALSLRNRIQPNAQKALELALDGYRLGKTDQVVVLEARKVYAEVTRQALIALSELYEAVDAIEQLTGACLIGEHH